MILWVFIHIPYECASCSVASLILDIVSLFHFYYPSIWWYFIMILISFFLINNELENLLICLLVSWISAFVKSTFKSHLIFLFFKNSICRRPVYIRNMSSFPVICVVNIFQSVACIFILLKFFKWIVVLNFHEVQYVILFLYDLRNIYTLCKKSCSVSVMKIFFCVISRSFFVLLFAFRYAYSLLGIIFFNTV